MTYPSDPHYGTPPPGRMNLPPDPYANLPVSKPRVTFGLIGILVIVWIITELAGGSQDRQVLVNFGANYGPLILLGESWRLFTSMFLHIGLDHLIANILGLIMIGLEMERLYGLERFIIIYLLAGLFGNLVSFAIRGPNLLSAGASGGVFGIIGMNLVFFLMNRQMLGEFGRQRAILTVIIIGYNLYSGFTTPGIDNLAHLGGLAAGIGLSFGVAPRYIRAGSRIADSITLWARWWILALTVTLLAGGVYLTTIFWLNRLASG